MTYGRPHDDCGRPRDDCVGLQMHSLGLGIMGCSVILMGQWLCDTLNEDFTPPPKV